MARTLARLPQGARITDYISLGVVAQWFPRLTVDRVLANSGKSSCRQRDLPAHVVVYYLIAVALYMQVSYREVLRCLLEGLQWAAGTARGAARGQPLGHLQSPHTTGLRAARTAARRVAASAGEAQNQRRFLPSLAAGLARWQHLGRGR